MTASRLSKESASASGVATVDVTGLVIGKIQATIHDVTTGTGTVTLTVMPSGTDEFQAVEEGTVLLSDATAPKTFIIDGELDQVKATSSSSSDVFKLLLRTT